MLVTDIPIDFKQTQSKQWFGMTLRQLPYGAGIAVLVAGTVALNIWAQLTNNPGGLQASQVMNNILPILLIPLIAFGWWRPHGLKPEVWIKAWIRQKQVLDKGPITRVGQMRPHRGTAPLPPSIMFDDNPETPTKFLIKTRGHRARHIM